MKQIIILLIALTIFHQTQQHINIPTAILNTLITITTLNLYKNPLKIWSNLIILTNPFVTAFTLFIIGINFFQLQQYTFNQSIFMATGTAFLGSLIGLIAQQYLP